MSVQHFRTAPDRVGQCATSLSDGPCDGGTPVPPALSSLALILLAMLLTACSGGSSAGTSPAVPADAAVRAEIEAAPVPAGVDNAVFEDLRGELLRVLCGRSALRAPLGSSNEIHDLLLSGSDSEGWLLSWSYLSCGDYDLNSEVNIADLTPIGLHYQHRFGDPGWLQSCRADGDGNGEVNIADVTPIGVNYGTTVAGYRIYGSQGEAGPWELVGELELPAVQLTERLQYELQTREHAWYQVRPFDRTDNEGLAGDCLLNCGPAVLQHSGTTASETIIIGPGGGSVNGPDRGFGPLSVSIPDGALESAMEISVGSVSGSVQLNGEDLGGDLYYISSAEAVNLALPITVRAWFDPQDRLAVQPLLEKLLSGRVGELINPDYSDAEDARPVLDWPTVIRQRAVVYCGFDALTDPEVAGVVGQSMIADLVAYAGELYKHGMGPNLPMTETLPDTCLHLDEFSELVRGPEIVQALNKGRGAGLRFVVYTQTLADIAAGLGHRERAQQVLGNVTNTLVMLRVADVETAELLTTRLGTVEVNMLMLVSGATDSSEPDSPVDFVSNTQERVSSQTTGLLEPGHLMQLPRGHAFVLMAGGRLYKTQWPELTDAPRPLPADLDGIARDMAQRYQPVAGMALRTDADSLQRAAFVAGGAA